MKKKNKISVLLTIVAIFLSVVFFVPLSNWSIFENPNQETEIEANIDVSYSGADVDFGAIDLSNIEYWYDGVLFNLPADGMLSFTENNLDTHNFTLYFSDITLQYIFAESITENILLTTKSINSSMYFDVDGSMVIADTVPVDLMYYNGTDFVIVESGITSSEGQIIFNNLIMGEYKIVEAGDVDSELSFNITQDMTSYTEDCVLIPEETVINFYYADSVFGAYYPVNMEGITWYLDTFSSTWSHQTNLSALCIDYTVVGGTITFYELVDRSLLTDGHNGDTDGYIFSVTGYNPSLIFIDIDVSGDDVYLTAKTLTMNFEFLDTTPASYISVDLYEGATFIGTYITDVNGQIVITELMPCGIFTVLGFEGQPISITPLNADIVADFTIAKDLSASFIWSSDSSLVVEETFDLYYEGVFYASYVSDVNGQINASNLKVGDYYFLGFETDAFTIDLADTIKMIDITVSSTVLLEERVLMERLSGHNLFIFFLIK